MIVVLKQGWAHGIPDGEAVLGRKWKTKGSETVVPLFLNLLRPASPDPRHIPGN